MYLYLEKSIIWKLTLFGFYSEKNFILTLVVDILPPVFLDVVFPVATETKEMFKSSLR